MRIQRPNVEIENREGETLDRETLDRDEMLAGDEETLQDERVEATRTARDQEPARDYERVRSENVPNRSEGIGRRAASSQSEELAPLFEAENARDYRARWDIVQRGFVDDPAKAVRDGDQLVSEVIKTLSETFAQARSTVETELSGQQNQGATELLRCALRRDRAFFERLLSV